MAGRLLEAPCSLVDIGFRGAYCLHHQDEMLVSVYSSHHQIACFTVAAKSYNIAT
jgi:hypothetical protein